MSNMKVTDWRDFAYRVRARQPDLLVDLSQYPEAVLISGCQRSGGTMLSRVITATAGMAQFKWSKDEELDAAMILSGQVRSRGTGRHCFQTTYLNERWPEYLCTPANFHLVWSLRNPQSVVYSMVYNWRRFALNELFVQCGLGMMDHADRIAFQRWGVWGVKPIRRAAYAFAGKVSQLFSLAASLPPERLTVLDYDALVRAKTSMLPALYDRLGLSFDANLLAMISERSLGKKDSLSERERQQIQAICDPVYTRALDHINLKPLS